jgi:aminopeptidase YwaD
LQARFGPYTMGSDHDVYQDSSFAIPAIYLNDWPDRYIHTNFDTAANIDPTKLKRAAFIGAASGYFLAQMNSSEDLAWLNAVVMEGRMMRSAQTLERRLGFTWGIGRDDFLRGEDSLLVEGARQYELDMANPMLAPGWFPTFVPEGWLAAPSNAPPLVLYRPKQKYEVVFFRRFEHPKGPLAVFGYDYFADHAKAAGIVTPKLLSYEGLWGSGEEYAYEVLNFADGKRSAQQIRDAVSAEYGPVSLELVVEYLQALERTGLVEQVK